MVTALKHIIEELEKHAHGLVVRPGFGKPHCCWCPIEAGLLFERTEQATVGSMLAHAKSAIGMDMRNLDGSYTSVVQWTPCHIETDIGWDPLGVTTIRLMCELATLGSEQPEPKPPQVRVRMFSGGKWGFEIGPVSAGGWDSREEAVQCAKRFAKASGHDEVEVVDG